MDLTEAEDFKKRWQLYTEGLYKKYLHDPYNYNGVINHLEPGILVCDLKWALGRITMNKASEGGGIPVELFHYWKMMLWKCCEKQYVSKFGKLSSGHMTGNRLVFIPIPKKGNAKKCSNYHTIELISHALKVMLKILQDRLQQYVNCELQDVQVSFRKGRGARDQIANIHWVIKIEIEFQKSTYFCFIDYAKAFDCVDHNKF